MKSLILTRLDREGRQSGEIGRGRHSGLRTGGKLTETRNWGRAKNPTGG